MKYNIFLVDADDTLLDFSACCKEALKGAMALCNIPYEEGDEEKYSAINDGLWKRLERKEITHDDVFRLRFYTFLQDKGWERESEKLNERYVDRLSASCEKIAGAEDFLTELKSMGRVFIVTNGTARVQRGRFKLFGMERFVEGVFISEELGAYKPAKEFLQAVEKRIDGFDKERALIIGDGLTSDILLGNNAGVDTLWLNFRKKENASAAQPTYEAETYQKALKIIRSV